MILIPERLLQDTCHRRSKSVATEVALLWVASIHEEAGVWEGYQAASFLNTIGEFRSLELLQVRQ